MNKILFLLSFSFLLGCAAQSQNQFSAQDFAKKLKETPDAQIIDVRTPGEFSGGHLENAQNIDWNGSDFQQQIAGLDKNKPTFVYCLSGGRSASAASSMRKSGFSKVYEMNGGMMQWRAQNLPETQATGTKKTTGLTQEQYEKRLSESNTLVLVDFYADWCAPCKKMKPYLEKMDKEMKKEVTIIRIDADANPELCKQLKVDALPVLKLYKKNTLVWDNIGFVDEQTVKAKIQSNTK